MHTTCSAGITGEQRTVTDEAVAFLRAELADGVRLAGEIKAEARKLGLSDTALFRARADARREGLENRLQGRLGVGSPRRVHAP